MDLCESTAESRRPAPAWTRALLPALVVLLMGGSVQAESPTISGMWVWSADAYRTTGQQVRLLTFCRDHHFNHLDVHVRMEAQETRARLTDEKELAELLLRAAEAKVTVSALRGSQKMFLEENHPRTLRELQVIVDFNQRLPAGARFLGIKYDVEPQTLTEWRSGGLVREKIMRDYLECLAKLRHALKSGTASGCELKLSADIPFWWDKEDLRLKFQDRIKPLSQHVQDLTDSVTLMSYRRDAGLVKLLVDGERAYAAQLGKSVLPALLHSKAASPDESSLSFHGLPAAEYERVRNELEQWAASRPGIGGVMHHHYGSLNP